MNKDLHIFVDGQHTFVQTPDPAGYKEWLASQPSVDEVIDPIEDGLKVYATQDGVYAFGVAVPKGASDVAHPDYAPRNKPDGDGNWIASIPVEKPLSDRIGTGLKLDTSLIAVAAVEVTGKEVVYAQTTSGNVLRAYMSSGTINTAHKLWVENLDSLGWDEKTYHAIVGKTLDYMHEGA